MAPASHIVTRMEVHKACTPISDKLAFCKTDLIGLGIIAFIVFFLLFCLERIVKVVRRAGASRAGRNCKPEVHLQSPTESKAPLFTASSTVKELFEGTKSMPPLYRCLERSASEFQYDYDDKSSRPPLHSRSSFLADVNSNNLISRPQLAHTRSDDVLRHAIPVPAGLDTQNMSDCSGDTVFGSPPRASSPPPALFLRMTS